MNMDWILDENAHAGAEHLDPDFVAQYDRKQGLPDPSPDIDAFLHHGLSADSTILDLGAGTGQFTLAAGRQFGRIIAVDVSPVMMEHLTARVAEAGLTNVECIQAGFLSYQHVGDQVDGIFTRNALHQIPDFFKGIALQRLARILRRGGVFRLRDLIYDFTADEAPGVLEEWFEAAVDDPAVGYTREDLAEHVRTEFSTYRWLLEPMLEEAGFRIEIVDFRRRVYGTYTCIRAAP